MEDAKAWQAVGVTTLLHKTLDKKKISLAKWGLWQHTTSLAEAAKWIEIGFNPAKAELWMDNKISPGDAAVLDGKLLPTDSGLWLKEGIKASQVLQWKALLPEVQSAGEFSREGLTPEEAAEWFDIGANAPEASIFKQGGWNPITVTNWLHINKIKYGEINKYIHATVSPVQAMEWKKESFSATDTKQWAWIQIQIDLAIRLRDLNIHPSNIAEFLNNEYTLDEAVELSIKKIPIKKASPPRRANKANNMSYSERVKHGLETELNKKGCISFEDFTREHTAQGNLYKNCPKSNIKNTIRIYVNNLTRGSIRQCKDVIHRALDKSFPGQQLDNLWAAEGYLDIGFETAAIKDKALTLEIYHNDSPL
ncbi:hypothetical protein DSO57_1002276 [Entomophthora muscae]|uniref:Uncharacterized protein n=1 Tax=Entomophthora muscae TaxID=34485 RepID=A0ACC2TKF5_9FUNG|nr:hypothetical protein DSO57_1002276 [Entomophthora muscae]